MGWNDSRVSLLAPGWTKVSEENTRGARTADGTPVRITYLKRVGGYQSTEIDRNAVEGWLETRGFELQRKREASSRLHWEDVEAFLDVEEGELAGIELTFTLSQNSPSRWESWRALVQQISNVWDLALYDSEFGSNVEAGEILRVLSTTQAWREFGERFAWPPVTSIENQGN
jgi:hypothetical protein